MQHFLNILKKRDLVAQISHEDELNEILEKGNCDANGKRYGIYCGFDPSARSLHVGNMVQIVALRRAQQAGLQPVVLFGGATGLIGDPTGRTEMRPMLTRDEIDTCVKNFRKLVEPFFDMKVSNAPIFVNNMEWFESMSWIEFSRNIGVHFTIARLLASEFSKSRLEHGLTLMEMSYQLMQAYDFKVLFEKHNCIMQLGGNDQWSNVLAGADLIRRALGKKAFALTTPLLVGSDGKKYGKTAGNAVWIDSSMTPPFDFFQFFRNTADADVSLVERVFSFKSDEELAVRKSKEINSIKEDLAVEICTYVHGKEEAEKALTAAQSLFAAAKSGEFSSEDLESLPKTKVEQGQVQPSGLDILEAFVISKLCASKGEARRILEGGGVTVNGEKVTDFKKRIREEDFLSKYNKGCLLKKGKKDYHLLYMSR